jgi:hypothetical protein
MARPPGHRQMADEEHIGSYQVLPGKRSLLWLAVIFGAAQGLVPALVAASWFTPANEGVGLYGRVIKLVASVDAFLFGESTLHVTTQRLALETRGRLSWELPLGVIQGVGLRTFGLHGNLAIHAGGGKRRRLSMWAADPQPIAAAIQAACQGPARGERSSR